MKNRLLLLMVYIAAGINMHAQTPGYMGKRLLLGVTTNYSPAFSSISTGTENSAISTNINYNGEVQNMFLYPLRLGVCIKYVISEERVLGLAVSYQKIGVTKADNNDDNYSEEKKQSSVTGGNSFKYSRAGFTTLALGLTGTETTAPIGFYGGQSLALIIGNIEAIDDKNNLYTIASSSIDVGMIMEFGYRRVAWDKILLEAGFDFSFYGKGFASFLLRESARSYADKVIYNAFAKNWMNNLCTVKIGVYYLL